MCCNFTFPVSTTVYNTRISNKCGKKNSLQRCFVSILLTMGRKIQMESVFFFFFFFFGGGGGGKSVFFFLFFFLGGGGGGGFKSTHKK